MKNRGVRNWFFFALKLFPLVSFCLAVHQTGNGDGAILAAYFEEYMEAFNFDVVSQCLITVFNDGVGFQFLNFGVIYYASYLVLILFVQIMYDVITFLPDFARGAFERGTRL